MKNNLPRLCILSQRLYNSDTMKTSPSDQPYVIDMRSDVLTRPTDEMRKAMAEATVGDDVFNEDPTVHGIKRIIIYD